MFIDNNVLNGMLNNFKLASFGSKKKFQAVLRKKNKFFIYWTILCFCLVVEPRWSFFSSISSFDERMKKKLLCGSGGFTPYLLVVRQLKKHKFFVCVFHRIFPLFLLLKLASFKSLNNKLFVCLPLSRCGK